LAAPWLGRDEHRVRTYDPGGHERISRGQAELDIDVFAAQFQDELVSITEVRVRDQQPEPPPPTLGYL
jgi:hypothetical protein